MAASPAGVQLAIDPYLGDACAALGLERLLPSPGPPVGTHIDLVCVTHAHLDHLDPDALTVWAQQGGLLVGPSSVVREARRILGSHRMKLRELRRGEQLVYGDVTVTAVPARHTPDSVGYVVDLRNGFRWYVTGDTLASARLINARTQSCTLLSVCMNGRLGNMRPRSAARLAANLNARWAMPMHWGMFARNTRDPQEFVACLSDEAAGVRALVVDPFRWYAYQARADPAGRWQLLSMRTWPVS